MPDRAFIDQLAEVWRSTAAVCAGLSPEQWDAPTECPGWTVRDHLSHVIGTESTLLGRPSPDPAPAGLPHVRNQMGEMNEAWVEARRRLPGDKVLAEFEDVTGTRLDALRAMSDAQLEEETPSPIGMVPYATFMDVRIMDCWVHEQDIRHALGRPGHIHGAAADVALGRLTSSFGFVVGKRVGPPEGSAVVLEITGPGARTVAVALRDGRARPLDPPAAPTATVATDVDAYTRLATGRWSAEEAVGSGRVTFAGDEALGRSVLENLSIMI